MPTRTLEAQVLNLCYVKTIYVKPSPFSRSQKILLFIHFISLALEFAGSILLINITLKVNRKNLMLAWRKVPGDSDI